jgi:flagellar export protein FliJ
MSDFRYRRLMEVKEKLLEHKQRELDMALTALRAVIDEIDGVRRETTRTYDDMTARCLTGNELSVLVGYLGYLDVKRAGLNEKRIEREERVAAIRTQLCDLEIELKMLEKLKSKTLQIIKKARNKKEQKLMDEIALRAERR